MEKKIYNVDINFANNDKYTLNDIDENEFDIIMRSFLKRKRVQLYQNVCVDFSQVIGVMGYQKE